MASYSQYLTKEKEDELRQIANAIIAPGKGILAADKSIESMHINLGRIGLKNIEENRRLYREILFTAPKECAKYVSGAIMFHETFYQKTADGVSFVDLLKKNGVMAGVEVGIEAVSVGTTLEEAVKRRFENLDARCFQYKRDGAQFAKWRCVHKIGATTPSDKAMSEIAGVLARYARVCQQNGLVPITEFEILPDGDHDLALSQEVTELALSYCYRALSHCRVFLEGTLLTLNVCTAGMQYKGPKPSHEDIGRATVTALQRSVPPAVPGVIFIPGGQSETDATLNLNAINQFPGKKPWALTFGYGHALQASVLSAWGGKSENVKKAGEALLERVKANSLACQGKFTGDEGGAAAGESLHVAYHAY